MTHSVLTLRSAVLVEHRQGGRAVQGAGRGGGDGFGVGVRHARKDTVAGEFLVGAGFSRESRLCLRPGKPNTPALLLRSGRRACPRESGGGAKRRTRARVQRAAFAILSLPSAKVKSSASLDRKST